MRLSGAKGRAFRAAFPCTLPILAGFAFLGMAYGVYMHALGFPAWYPVAMAVVIFGGSLEFIAGTMLTAPFAPTATFVVAFMVQARHLFYGLSMLEKYKGLGWKKPLLIFWLCDESFSLNYTARVPDGVDRGWFYLFVSALNYSYWLVGVSLGSFVGASLSAGLYGIEFVMMTMFVVIFLEQWRKEKKHLHAYIGLSATVLCRLVFGADGFILPAMGLILLGLTVLRRPLERKGGVLRDRL